MTTATPTLDGLRRRADEEFARRGLWRRVWDGFRRRALRAWSWVGGEQPPGHACQRALDWLLAQQSNGMTPRGEAPGAPCARNTCQLGLRGAISAALACLEFGEHAAAQSWLDASTSAGESTKNDSPAGGTLLVRRVSTLVASACPCDGAACSLGWLDERAAAIESLLGEVETVWPAEEFERTDGAVSTFCLARAAAGAFRSRAPDLYAFAVAVVRGLTHLQSREGWLPGLVLLDDISTRRGIRLRAAADARSDERLLAWNRIAATSAFLVAASWEARSLPEGEQLEAYLEIDRTDGRALAVRAWAEDVLRRVPPRAAPCAIADLGCGAGRYLRLLRAVAPDTALVGIDASLAMLAALPPFAVPRQGDLRFLPAADAEFDAAYCVEALEHSLAPRRAVAEICRVVRPGGQVLIIDKNAARQPLSEHRPWERWFQPLELVQWLTPYCKDVKAVPIPHGSRRAPTGLFYCWTGVRRA